MTRVVPFSDVGHRIIIEIDTLAGVVGAPLSITVDKSKFLKVKVGAVVNSDINRIDITALDNVKHIVILDMESLQITHDYPSTEILISTLDSIIEMVPDSNRRSRRLSNEIVTKADTLNDLIKELITDIDNPEDGLTMAHKIESVSGMINDLAYTIGKISK